jgi:hypothetical protein
LKLVAFASLAFAKEDIVTSPRENIKATATLGCNFVQNFFVVRSQFDAVAKLGIRWHVAHALSATKR